MISPDELADRLTPPAGTGRTYTRQLALSDSGMDLAETILNETARGPLQDQAFNLLVEAMRAAYAAVAPDATDDPARPAPYRLADQGGTGPDPALLLDVGVWRLGMRTSRMHPHTRLVGLVLAEFCGASGRIADAQQPTLRDLSEQTGLQMNVLHVHLHDLTSRGWISRHAHVDAYGSRRSTFQLRLPA